jgi:hypothetical protein
VTTTTTVPMNPRPEPNHFLHSRCEYRGAKTAVVVSEVAT